MSDVSARSHAPAGRRRAQCRARRDHPTRARSRSTTFAAARRSWSASFAGCIVRIAGAISPRMAQLDAGAAREGHREC